MMSRKIFFVVLTFVLVSVLGSAIIFAQEEETHTVDMTINGSLITISEGVGLFDVDLQGSPGAARERGLAFSYPVDYADLPDGNQCFDLDNGEAPDGLLITTDSQISLVFNDGSMLFGNGGEDGYVCFAPGYAYAPYVLAGGIGRFEGATGNLQFDIETHAFGAPGSPVVPETGTASGEIILP